MVVDGTTTVELNEAQGTATVHFAAFSLQGQISPELPARTVGPMNAKFTEETVTFDNPDPNSAPDGCPDEYVLNRLTGELRGKWGEDSEICQVGTKQF